MATATWIRNLLEQRGVAFEEMHHREVFTARKSPRANMSAGTAWPKSSWSSLMDAPSNWSFRPAGG